MKDGKAVVVRCTLNLVWGDRKLSGSQPAKARKEDLPLPPSIAVFEFPPTPGVGQIKLQPSQAAERRVQGVAPDQAGTLAVVLSNVLIGTDDHVQQAVAVNPTSPYLAEAAQTVMQWIYRPVMVNGNPAEAVTVVPVAVPAK